MLTKQDNLLLSSIENNIFIGNNVRVYYKDHTRSPVYGRFVKRKDYEELLCKGYVRFILADRIESYDHMPSDCLTRVVAINTLHSLKHF